MDDRGNSGNNSGSQNLVTNMSPIVFFSPKSVCEDYLLQYFQNVQWQDNSEKISTEHLLYRPGEWLVSILK